MDLHKMIGELQEERNRIDEAINALERLAAGKARRRGRPPAWLTGHLEYKTAEPEEEEEETPSAPKSRKS